MRALLKLACDLLSENRDEIAASYLVDDKLVFRDSVDDAARDRLREIDDFIANAKEELAPVCPMPITEDWLKHVGFKWQRWDIHNHIFGSVRTPETAARIHADNERMDLRFLRDGHPWRPSETDPARGRPLTEHMEKAIETGKAK